MSGFIRDEEDKLLKTFMPEEKKMSFCCGADNNCHRAAVIIVALVLLAAIVVSAILRDRIVNQQWRTVTVTGQGRVAYNPDLAIVTLGVQIDKVAQPEEALNQLNTKASAIIAAVKELGLPAESIQTQNYSLYPQYDYADNTTTVSGYNANQQLVIKVDAYDQDQGKLSRVIAAASKAGANQIHSLSFDSSQMNELKQRARIAAIEDAKDKSTDLAATAGVKLKNIVSWYENYMNPMPIYGAYDYAKGGLGAGGGGGAEAPSGEREVLIEIGVTYNIK